MLINIVVQIFMNVRMCIVESEIHMVQALEDIKAAGCNALCVYLGNFGPEISETLRETF